MTTYRARTSLIALATMMAAPAFAQASGEATPPAPAAASNSRTTVYPASFFAQYAPRNALDIARQVPAFQIDFGDTNLRGFGGAAGNIVINGARPSSKSEDLGTTLSRSPANRVVRVEVGPGDLFGADYSSKSQVLNIILSAEGGLDGNITGSLRRLYTGAIVPDGSISALIKRGSSTINLSAGFNNNVNHEEGTDTIRDITPPLATGDLLEYRRKFNSYHDFNPFVAASWALEKAPDNAIRVNARWSPGQFDLYQANRVTVTGEDPRDDNLIQDYDQGVFELSGDITRPLGGGAIKLVGLATRRKVDNFDRYIQRDGLASEGAVQVGGFEQTQKADRNETIGRLTWTKQNIGGGFSFETGIEAALNTLDNTTELFVVEEDGSKTQIDLPVDSAKVEEKRAEAFVNIGKQLSPSLRFDAGMRYEYSHLTVSGDAEADRKLRFWKPSLTLDWKPGKGWHTQFSVKRTVAQLNFFDFVTAAELSTDRVNAGNANLEPQRTWEFRATADHALLGDGQVKLDLGYDNISLFQDRVLICDPDHPGDASFCFDAPGNIGTGKRSFAALTVDAPLQKLGLSGTRLKLFGQLQKTRVEDPISGEKRNFSDFYPEWQWEVSIRRDKGAWSYGFAVSDRDRFTFFRTDEFDTNFNTQPYATAFVEYRPDKRTSVTFDIDNAINTHGARNREIYIPNRAAADPFVINEFRERNRHLNLGLTVKRTFGGGGQAQASPGG
jgi:hypothetical protein